MLVHLYGLAGSGKTTFLKWFIKRSSGKDWSIITLDTVRKFLRTEQNASRTIEWFKKNTDKLIYESVGAGHVDWQLRQANPDMVNIYITTNRNICLGRIANRYREDFENYSDSIYTEYLLMDYEDRYLDKLEHDFQISFENRDLEKYQELENYLATLSLEQTLRETET